MKNSISEKAFLDRLKQKDELLQKQLKEVWKQSKQAKLELVEARKNERMLDEKIHALGLDHMLPKRQCHNKLVGHDS